MAASILKISISQNANCDNMIGFPKLGHIYVCTWSVSETKILAVLENFKIQQI